MINKCKIIINVHNFDAFNIFEHIRCDRLVFSNKIILSEFSLYQEDLDIKDYIIWEDYDKIMNTANYILENFEKFDIKKDFMNLINNRKKILQENIDKIVNMSSM